MFAIRRLAVALSRAEISRRARVRAKAGLNRRYRVPLSAEHLWELADRRGFPDEMLADVGFVESELTRAVWEILTPRNR